VLTSLYPRHPRHMHKLQCSGGRVTLSPHLRPAQAMARVAVVARPAWMLPGSTCALALRATTAPPRRPPLAVSCAPHPPCGPILMAGRAAVTTQTAGCVQCAAGKYQDMDSEQMSTCAPCYSGYYAAGMSALLTLPIGAVVSRRPGQRRQPYLFMGISG
jgi:hypothetical protein